MVNGELDASSVPNLVCKLILISEQICKQHELEVGVLQSEIAKLESQLEHTRSAIGERTTKQVGTASVETRVSAPAVMGDESPESKPQRLTTIQGMQQRVLRNAMAGHDEVQVANAGVNDERMSPRSPRARGAWIDQGPCPGGHPLTRFTTRQEGYECNSCKDEFPKGTILYGCRSCDYDSCISCLQELQSQLRVVHFLNKEERAAYLLRSQSDKKPSSSGIAIAEGASARSSSRGLSGRSDLNASVSSAAFDASVLDNAGKPSQDSRDRDLKLQLDKISPLGCRAQTSGQIGPIESARVVHTPRSPPTLDQVEFEPPLPREFASSAGEDIWEQALVELIEDPRILQDVVASTLEILDHETLSAPL